MSLTDAFKTLGLERANASEADVKKAYARLLKETRPDADPEGFMQLREAFSHARMFARGQDTKRAAEPNETAEDIPVVVPAFEAVDDPFVEAEPEEEIKYWYDEELQYHFNSSPFGKLVERTIRWIRSENPDDPEEFFADVASSPVLKQDGLFRSWQEFLLGRIYHDAIDGQQIDEYDFDTNPDIIRPKWLTDQVILVLQSRFDLLGCLPVALWQARPVNTMIELFTPVLSEQGVITDEPPRHDPLDLFEKQETEWRSDDHGSYFDREQKRWVEMSPVAIALRDIAELTKRDIWGADTAAWREILSRDALEAIDEFRALDVRLVQFICNESDIYSNLPSKKLSWLSEDVLLLLDDTFGWAHQFGQNVYDRKQYDFIHKLISRYRKPPERNNVFQEVPAQAPVQTRGYAAPRWLRKAFKPWNLFFMYVAFRIISTLTGL